MSALCILFLLYCITTSINGVSVKWTLANETMPRAWASMGYGYNSSQIWLLGGEEEDDLWSRNEWIFKPSTGKFELLFPDISPDYFECAAQCSAQFPILQNESDFDIFIMGPIQQKSHGDNGWIFHTNNDLWDYTTFSYFPDQAEWPCTVADNTHFDNSPVVYSLVNIYYHDIYLLFTVCLTISYWWYWRGR